jgi:hypothetical protein
MVLDGKHWEWPSELLTHLASIDTLPYGHLINMAYNAEESSYSMLEYGQSAVAWKRSCSLNLEGRR